MHILMTKHAKDKQILLGINIQEIKDAIKRGAKIKQTDSYLASYGYLRVAYKTIGKEIYKVKTVFIG